MKVWGVSFKEIENEWTDDEYYMMIARLAERIDRENKTSKGGGNGNNRGAGTSSNANGKSYGTKEFLATMARPKTTTQEQ